MRRLSGFLLCLILALTGCAGPADQTVSAPQTETPSPVCYDCDLLFFGDSITAWTDFASGFPAAKVVNLGVAGDTITDLLARVPELAAHTPRKVFLLGGINALRDDSYDECLEEYDALLSEVQAACPESEIYIQSVLPISRALAVEIGCSIDTIRRFNDAIRAMAERRGMRWLDLWPVFEREGGLNPVYSDDGIHLNENGGSAWIAYLRPLAEFN